MFYNFKANDIIEEYREGSEPSLVVELLKIIIAEDNSVEVDEEKLKAVFEEAKNNSRLARLVKKYKDGDELISEYTTNTGIMTSQKPGGVPETFKFKDLIKKYLQLKGFNTNTSLKSLARTLTSKKGKFSEYDIEEILRNYDNVIRSLTVAEDGLIKIVDVSGEEFEFYRADEYYSAETPVGKYIAEKGVNQNLCHEYTHALQAVLPEAVSVTSKMPRNFDGNYYVHSYTELGQEEKVLDLSMNLVMPRTQYESMMKPIEKMFSCRNKDVKQKIEKIQDLLILDPNYEAFQDCGYHHMLILSAFETLKQADPKTYHAIIQNMQQASKD